MSANDRMLLAVEVQLAQLAGGGGCCWGGGAGPAPGGTLILRLVAAADYRLRVL